MAGSARDRAFPPTVSVMLKTTFFMPRSGSIHGPPVVEYPGVPIRLISMSGRAVMCGFAARASTMRLSCCVKIGIGFIGLAYSSLGIADSESVCLHL
jgi:hypothetical protein